MFKNTTKGTLFSVTKDRDQFYGTLRSLLSQNHRSPAKIVSQIDKRYQSYRAFSAAVSGVGGTTGLLLVLSATPTPGKDHAYAAGHLHFAGVVHNPDGIGAGDTDLMISTKFRKGASFELFETFWSESLFWSQFVKYAFRKQVFGGPLLEAVEAEQKKSNIVTNRDGWVNGRTWTDQQASGLPTGSIGSHRGEADEIRTSRGAVNF